VTFCIAQKEEEEGDSSNAAIAFFFFFFSCNTKKKKAKAALLPSPSFVPLRCSVAKQALQRSVVLQSASYVVELRCKVIPQTNKQNKREKKKKMFT